MRPALSLTRSRRLGLELLVLALVFVFGGLTAPALAAQVTQVLVVNPTGSPVPVAGTVNVGNLPATQAVDGTVGLSSGANTVKIDSTANTVNVGNFPATQNVNVTGGTVSAAQRVSNVITTTGFHSVAQGVEDTVSLGSPGLNVTAIAVDDGLSEQDSWRVVVIDHFAMKVATGSGNLFLPLPQPMLMTDVDVQCLSPGGCFWSIEVSGYSAP